MWSGSLLLVGLCNLNSDGIRGILRYDARLTARAASYGEGILISSFLAMGCISDDLSRQVWLQAFCEAGAYPIDWMREQHLFLELGVVR